MKKIFRTLIILISLIIVSLIIYWKLPFEIIRKSDIKFGNKLIENINSYKLKHNKLPENDDWNTLEKLGFKIEMLGTKPSYEKNQKGEYELIFLEGFDGPYLMWNSTEKKWKIDFPTIFAKTNSEEENNKQNKNTIKINGKTIIFLRPSEEKFDELKDNEGIYEVDSDFGFAIQRTIEILNTNPKLSTIKNEVITDRYIEIEDCYNRPKIIDRDNINYGLILTETNKKIKIIPNIQTLNYTQTIEENFK